ncbi:MAG: hypothetical protein Ta2D_02090 [Rickettsiales bacterium]|nr:MAG: hypothetical protein Ta2D_02090 [Rickettsiales bacterium]
MKKNINPFEMLGGGGGGNLAIIEQQANSFTPRIITFN